MVRDDARGPDWFDASETVDSKLYVTREGRYYKVSAAAHMLLQLFDAGLQGETAARKFNASFDTRLTGAEADAAHAHVRAQVLPGPPDRSANLTLRLPIFPAHWVESLSQRAAFLFHPGIGGALVLACLVINISTFLLNQSRPAAHEPLDFARAYGLFLVSLFAHEIGHAAACAHFGAKPREIGFGFYLMFPVMYCDVTDAWRLPRGQRVIVDLGGVYFQMLIGSLLAAVFAWTQASFMLISLYMVWSSCILALNPAFKYDGYWVVSDALGVPNLAMVRGRVRKAIVDVVRGRSAVALPWRSATLVLLVIYTLIASVLGLYLVARMLALAASAVLTLGHAAAGETSSAAQGASTVILALGLAVFCARYIIRLIALRRRLKVLAEK